MTTTQHTAPDAVHLPVLHRAATIASEASIVTTRTARRSVALLRLAVGFVFLWAFLDKTFGLGFSTASAGAWVNGGSPATGFLTHGTTGPLAGFFAGLAGPVTDVLFMAAMLGIGLAVMLGVGLRISAVVGTLVLALMYLAEWPFAAGASSTNPLVDYHVVYALSLIVVAAASAGDTWGLGRVWKRLPIVQRLHWLV